MKLQYLSVRIYLPYTAVCTTKYRLLKNLVIKFPENDLRSPFLLITVLRSLN